MSKKAPAKEAAKKPAKGEKEVAKEAPAKGGAKAPAKGAKAPAKGALKGGAKPGEKRGFKNRPKPQKTKEDELKAWIPVTKLGRLVKAGLVRSLEEVFYFSMPVKEVEIIATFIPKLEDQVMRISPVQKQTRAGQRTRFKAWVVVGDRNGHVGLGVKCAKEVANAIRGAIYIATLSVIPIRRGYWGNKVGSVHTVPCKVTGRCGSISVRLVPAPKGTGIVAGKAPKKVLQFAGIEDCFTKTSGHTATLGNFIRACFNALSKTYSYLTPDLWKEHALTAHPFIQHSAFFDKKGKEDEKI